LIDRLVSHLVIAPAEIDIGETFASYGISSRDAVGLSGDLARWLGCTLSANILYDYPSIEQVTRYLVEPQQEATEKLYNEESSSISTEPIAIIGMGCRFPGGVNTPEAFWQLLTSGHDAITEVPHTRWDVERFYNADHQAPGKMYTRAGGFVSDIDSFDAQFFGISPREALRMDPQQRLLLEVAWEAFEHAGIAADELAGSKVGVFVGMVGSHDYARIQEQQGDASYVNDPYYGLGISSSIAAGRISYHFDLRGPSLTIDTACSSSLVALHLACQSLLNHECDLALVGGVNAVLHPGNMVNFCKMSMLAVDGRCKTFDASADGFAFGEGCGIVVLKRVAEAVTAGDTMLALIRGSAVNQDGRSNGITAPNRLAQEQVLRKALQDARLSPEQVSYIEAHGSGTALGDPIEIGALESVFAANRRPDQRLLVGSVKTNIGHLVGAAGIAGLMKTVLALYHKQIPAHLNVKTLNPHLAAAVERAMTIPDELTPWHSGEEPRRAGVNSFGWSGTNAHVILEEAPAEQSDTNSSRSWQCLLLSAKTASSLGTTTKNLAAYLRQHTEIALADVCYTYNAGRSMLGYRHMVLCQTREEAIAHLEDYTPAQAVSRRSGSGQLPVTFLFPGLGEQYPGMAYELYEQEPLFRSIVEQCAQLLLPHLKKDIRELIYPQNYARPSLTTHKPALDLRAFVGRGKHIGQSDEATEQLKQTMFAQPALFVIEYALAQLWIAWGVQPQAMLGHSLGEYVAACIAGVFSLEDALFLVVQRARLVQSLPGGGMTAVALSEADARSFTGEGISLAAINSQQSCVLSGPLEALVQVEETLTERGIVYRRLQTSHAFHSSMMEPVRQSLIALVSTVTLHEPQIPYISDVTGAWITAEQATDYAYWAEHVCQPVRFADGLHEVLQQVDGVLLEVGPGQGLCSFARQQAAYEQLPDAVILSSLPHAYDRRSAQAQMLQNAGRLWQEGIKLDWSGFYAYEKRQRLQLPTYAFEHQRYWIDSKQSSIDIQAVSVVGRKPDMADWFYRPTWKCTPHTLAHRTRPLADGPWLVFVDTCMAGAQLVTSLRAMGQDVTCVVPGKRFERVDKDTYSISVDLPGEYVALLQHLQRLNKFPHSVLHLWMVTPPDSTALSLSIVENGQQLGLYSLLYLAQAIGGVQGSTALKLFIFSDGVQDVIGTEALRPEKATILSFCKVLAKEYPSLSCCNMDIELPRQDASLPPWLLEQLLTEITLPRVEESMVAYRGMYRWTQSFEPVRLERAAIENVPLREQGVYLITGGLGGLGSALASYLAQRYRAQLALLCRSELPEREHWREWLVKHGVQDTVSEKIRQIQQLEEQGAEVMVIAADVANKEQMRSALDRVRVHFGPLQGVFHLAGVPGTGLIQLKKREQIENVLAPKVKGTLVLAELVEEEPLDFMVLYSSSIVITGGVGELEYAAANAFLDAFAAYSRQRYSWPCFVIDWGPWCWDAWQESMYAPQTEGRFYVRKMREQYGITFADGEEALTRVLASALRRVVVLTQDIPTTIEQWSRLATPEFLAQASPARPGYARPNLKNPYVPPSSADEQKIAKIWQDALGIEAVGIHDHFFELGGNSLIGMQVIARLQQEFQQELGIVNLFEGPTISTLLQIIRPAPQARPLLATNSHRGKMRKERSRSIQR
jgi:acyl transferase domain-containing protein/acyl carrier protein